MKGYMISVAVIVLLCTAELINCEECLHGFTKPHETNCQKYYICINDEWILKSCPPNDYYSVSGFCLEDKNVCNYRPKPDTPTTKPVPTRPHTTWTVKMDNCLEDESKFYSKDCTKYYQCVNQIWQLHSCKGYTYYDKNLKECVPEDGTCRFSTTQPTPPIPCVESDNKEYPYDCTKYFRCVNRKWKLKSCDGYTYYHRTRKECVPEDGNCRSSTTITTPAPECIEFDKSEYVNDCTKYYQCVNQIWQRQSCKGYTYYDKNLKECVPEDGTCRFSTTQPTPQIPCVESDNKEYPYDCTKYFRCVNRKWKLKSCDGYTYYHRIRKECVPEDGNCRSSTTITTPAPECIEFDKSEYVNDCTKYYQCVNQIWQRQSCKGYTYYDKNLKECVPEDGTCRFSTTQPIPPMACVESDVREHPGDCKKYFRCVNQIWQLQSCEGDTYYNKARKECVPEDGTCRPLTTLTTPECSEFDKEEYKSDCTKYYQCINQRWKFQTCDGFTYFNKNLKVCVPEDGNCRSSTTPTTPSSTLTSRCKFGSFKVDETISAKYFFCIKGDWKIFACPLYSYFNMEYKMCMPENLR